MQDQRLPGYIRIQGHIKGIVVGTDEIGFRPQQDVRITHHVDGTGAGIPALGMFDLLFDGIDHRIAVYISFRGQFNQCFVTHFFSFTLNNMFDQLGY